MLNLDHSEFNEVINFQDPFLSCIGLDLVKSSYFLG